jgi:glucoamylase
VNTVRVIDALLRTETRTGPVWHRYNQDGYGEHENGGPFDGRGVGRGWPLLVGERAHYELAAGHRDEAEKLRLVMAAQSGAGRLIPEQVWDASDFPQLELFNGRPSGSAMPLVWAHAEYIKLTRSLRDGRVFDLPPQTVQRYQKGKQDTAFGVWRFNHKRRTLPEGRLLRLETLAPSLIHWGTDGWQAVHDTETRDTGLGIYLADLPTQALPVGSVINFTFYWPEAGRWESVDFAVRIE